MISFVCYRPLRKPVNRFSFCISVSNTLACVAYSWGRYPVDAGRNTAFCQTQGFMITWFVMSDPLLVMVMALNVYWTVHHKRSLKELKKTDVIGIGLAFALPFPSALTFLLWRPHGRTVYGDATSWCWISKESGLLRLVAFYVPIWISILTSLVLFALSGKSIVLVRRRLNAVKTKNPLHQSSGRPDPEPDWCRADGIPESTSSSDQDSRPAQVAFSEPDYSDDLHSNDLQRLAPSHSIEAQLTRSPSYQFAANIRRERTHSSTSQTALRKTPSRFDAAHWKYAQFAFLYTIVLLITWVPISVNRVYNTFIAPPNKQIYSLYLASSICIPFHGFGNAIIYTITSWSECRDFLACRSPRRPSVASDTSCGLGEAISDLFKAMRQWPRRVGSRRKETTSD